MKPQYKHGVDDNQPEIVAGLRQVPGVSVKILSGVGDDFPDIIVGFRGSNYLIEIKPPGGKQSPGQREFEQGWNGQYGVAETLLEALSIIGVCRKVAGTTITRPKHGTGPGGRS